MENVVATPRLHALLIGIGDYIQFHYANLPATVRDAQALVAILIDPIRCGYLPGNVLVIAGKQATAANTRMALKTLAESTNPEMWNRVCKHRLHMGVLTPRVRGEESGTS